MEISTEEYQRIMRFLDAGMTLEEMDAFEKELMANPAMRQQLDFEQSVRDRFSFSHKQTLPQQKSEYEPIVTPLNKPVIVNSSTKKIWPSIAAAAAVIVIVVSAVLLKQKKEAPVIAIIKDSSIVKPADTSGLTIATPFDSSRQQLTASLYKQYFTKDDLPESYPMYLAEALTSYQNGDYALLQQLNLTDIPATRGTENKETILNLGHYYKGIAFLKTGSTAQAISNLQWVDSNNRELDLKIKAKWYLALAHLKNNDITKATNLLKKIRGNNTYHTRAVHLLKALQ